MWYTQAIEPTGRREPQWQTSTSSRSSRTTPTTSSCPSSTAVWSAVLRGRPGSRHPGPLPHPSGRLGQGRVRGRRAHLRGRAGRSVLCPPQPAHPLYCRRGPAVGVQLGRLQRCLRPQACGAAAFHRRCPRPPHPGPGGDAGGPEQHLLFRGLQPQDEAAMVAISTCSSPP